MERRMCGTIQTERKEVTGLHRITKKRLLELCKKDKLYQTPSLNDVLYLHYQGFQYIECLEEYSELKCLWLECNAISEIEGLENQSKLKCLFLQSNLIKRIQNLEHCSELDTLNLSSNHIRKVENCGSDVLPHLNTLNLSSNYLKDSEGLRELENCKNLSVLDLSNNRIDDILAVKVFAKMPQLRVLVLQGNPVVSKVPQYRKTLILECKELTYLDSRPVFPKDRACAEAWKRGGYDEERKENERWNRKERRKIRDSVNATISMRNRHLAVDAQLTLLNSSDSEDEAGESKRRRRTEVDAGVSLELGVWDEVEDAKSENSSDMNVSSSTSVISTTDSNGNVSCDSKAHETAEILNNTNTTEKIQNNATDQNLKVLEVAHTGGIESIPNLLIVRESTEQVEVQPQVSESIVESAKPVIEELQPTPTAKQQESTDECKDSEDERKEDFNEAVAAICKIATNDLSHHESPKRRVKLQIEVEASSENNEPEMVIQQFIDNTIGNSDSNTDLKEEEDGKQKAQDKALAQMLKTAEQLIYERECEEVNKKLEKDFEELSANMDIFMLELQKNKEVGNMSDDGVLYEKTREDQLDSSASSQDDQDISEEFIVQQKWLKFNKMIPLNVMKLVPEHSKMEQPEENHEEYSKEEQENMEKSSSLQSKTEKELTVNEEVGDDTQIDTIVSELSEDTLHINTTTATYAQIPKIVISDCSTNPVEINISAAVESEQASGDHEQNLHVSSIVTQVDKLSEKVELVGEGRSAETNAAIIAYEKEATELRVLLQKLEDENERLYNINSNYRQMLDEDIREEIKYQDKASSEGGEKLCAELIDELVESLELKEQRPNKPKSYEFIDLESDDEFSYTEPARPEEPVKSIRDVLGSFNAFFKEVTLRNRETMQRRREQRQKPASTAEQKAESLQQLLKSPNLQEFNADTHESLDARLETLKEQQTKHVQKLVDRVYAQKDKYDDTLEVMNGKLVVVKKDSGEIENLPERRVGYYSDSEDGDNSADYDTAESDMEATGAKKWNISATPRGMWNMPYKPTLRLPATQLIEEAMLQNKARQAEAEAAAEDDDADEQYHSLEDKSSGIFSNIDEEFFRKIDFEQLKANEANDNNIVECVRSYEELKRFMKCSKEQRCLTEEENILLKQMLARSEPKEDGEDVATGAESALTAAENLLLQKMVERTKARDREEKSKQSEEDAKHATPVPQQEHGTKQSQSLVKEMVTLFEYDGSRKNADYNKQAEVQDSKEAIESEEDDAGTNRGEFGYFKDPIERMPNGKEIFEELQRILEQMKQDVPETIQEDVNSDEVQKMTLQETNGKEETVEECSNHESIELREEKRKYDEFGEEELQQVSKNSEEQVDDFEASLKEATTFDELEIIFQKYDFKKTAEAGSSEKLKLELQNDIVGTVEKLEEDRERCKLVEIKEDHNEVEDKHQDKTYMVSETLMYRAEVIESGKQTIPELDATENKAADKEEKVSEIAISTWFNAMENKVEEEKEDIIGNENQILSELKAMEAEDELEESSNEYNVELEKAETGMDIELDAGQKTVEKNIETEIELAELHVFEDMGLTFEDKKASSCSPAEQNMEEQHINMEEEEEDIALKVAEITSDRAESASIHQNMSNIDMEVVSRSAIALEAFVDDSDSSPEMAATFESLAETMDAPTTNVQVLECRLQVYGCSDQLTNEIAVNAKLVYDYEEEIE